MGFKTGTSHRHNISYVFERKLKQLKKQIAEKNLMQVPRLNANQATDNLVCINSIQDLQQQFEITFTGIDSQKTDFKWISQLLDVKPESKEVIKIFKGN